MFISSGCQGSICSICVSLVSSVSIDKGEGELILLTLLRVFDFSRVTLEILFVLGDSYIVSREACSACCFKQFAVMEVIESIRFLRFI